MTYCTVEKPVARKTPPPPSPPPEDREPPSETARVSGDLMEMLRDIQDHLRRTRGKRPKMAQLIDDILRPAVTREWQKLGLGKEGA